MGMFQVKVKIANPLEPGKVAEAELVVSNRATLSWIARDVLQELNIQPHHWLPFVFSDGRRAKRDVGFAVLTVADKSMGVPIAFAERGDVPVFGLTSLEILGLEIDPSRNRLLNRRHPYRI